MTSAAAHRDRLGEVLAVVAMIRCVVRSDVAKL